MCGPAQKRNFTAARCKGACWRRCRRAATRRTVGRHTPPAAASYVNRIFRGAKVAELQPIKYELTINVKTAKTLGLALPDSVLARADEVIE